VLGATPASFATLRIVALIADFGETGCYPLLLPELNLIRRTPGKRQEAGVPEERSYFEGGFVRSRNELDGPIMHIFATSERISPFFETIL
jgi:hypothetical protein